MKEATESARTAWLPFHGDRGPRDGLRARVRDLERERERLVEQVLHLERVAQAGLMTAGLTHDLLNQLTAVLGSAELALHAGDEASLREGLSDVVAHARRMHETTEAFLGFVRRREHRVREVAIEEVVESARRLAEPVARAEGVALLSSCSTGVRVRADRQLLEQAVVNLVLNAVRAASQGGGRVVVSATDAPGGARISVRDTGPGIHDAVREHLFEPFATGHAERGGHGLGLWIARQVAERYGGRIGIDTSAAGTRVDIDLPAPLPE